MVNKKKSLLLLLTILLGITFFAPTVKADPTTATKKLYGKLSTELTMINEFTGLKLTRYYLTVFSSKYELTSIVSKITPDKEVGAWYTCYYDVATDGKTPTFHYCVKGEVDDGKTITIPQVPTPTPAAPSTPTTPTTPDPSGSNTQQTGGEMTIDLNADINASGIDGTKCPDGQTTYQKGVLKGVSCTNATRSLGDVLLIVKNIVTTLLLPIVGVLFLIMMMIGGVLYITSAGNQQRADRGKKILTAAIIGLLIVTLSYTLIAIFANIIGGGIA